MVLVYHLRLIGKFTNAYEAYACFVYMMWNITLDIALFLVVLAIVLATFCHFFYVLFFDISTTRAKYFEEYCQGDDTDDPDCEPTDDAVYGWDSVQGSFKNVVMMGLGIAGPSGMPGYSGEVLHFGNETVEPAFNTTVRAPTTSRSHGAHASPSKATPFRALGLVYNLVLFTPPHPSSHSSKASRWPPSFFSSRM